METVYKNRFYHSRMRWSLVTYPIIIVANLLLGIVNHDRVNLIVGILFVIMLPLTLQTFRNHLIVTPEGITYHSGYASLSVPWQDMEYIGRAVQRKYRGWDGIMLRQAHWKSPPLLRLINRWRPPFIPLWNKWTGPWWDRELFDEVFYYAPWLAGEGRNSTNLPVERETRQGAEASHG